MEKVQERALRFLYDEFSSSYEDLLQKKNKKKQTKTKKKTKKNKKKKTVYQVYTFEE